MVGCVPEVLLPSACLGFLCIQNASTLTLLSPSSAPPLLLPPCGSSSRVGFACSPAVVRSNRLARPRNSSFIMFELQVGTREQRGSQSRSGLALKLACLAPHLASTFLCAFAQVIQRAELPSSRKTQCCLQSGVVVVKWCWQLLMRGAGAMQQCRCWAQQQGQMLGASPHKVWC